MESSRRDLFIIVVDGSIFEKKNKLRSPLFHLHVQNRCGTGSCHKRQKLQAPTPQAPIRNRQTRKVANAKGLYRNTNLT